MLSFAELKRGRALRAGQDCASTSLASLVAVMFTLWATKMV